MIIHIVGLIAISLTVFIKKEKPFAKMLPAIWYFGGIIGVATTLCNNYGFGKISLSAIIALGLIGQVITSILIDQFGLLGMHRRPFEAKKLLGIFFVLMGTTMMMQGSPRHWPAIAVSLIAGITVVVARSLNAYLSQETSLYISSWFNYVTGLVVSFLAFLILSPTNLTEVVAVSPPPIWVFTGGLLGLTTVVLNSVVTIRIPALYLSILIFIGQIFTGIALDVVLTGQYSSKNLIGGLLMILGKASMFISIIAIEKAVAKHVIFNKKESKTLRRFILL